jgi:preprotein translocase subunit YajC
MNKLSLVLPFFLSLSTNAFASSQVSGSAMSSIVMLISFFAIFYFLFIRPQAKRNKNQREMLSEISKGDEVVTTGGIIARVLKVGMNYTEIEISEDVVIKIQKNSISSVLPKGTIKTN